MKKRREFISNLEHSYAPVWTVGGYLASKGYTARILPPQVTPDTESRFEYQDQGDIEITQRIEVKQWVNNDFKSLDDVKYQNIIVDEKYKIERYPLATLHGYMILNASKTAAITISAISAGVRR
jgi:hypothetical protein